MMKIFLHGREICKDGITANGIPNGYSWIQSQPTPELQLIAKWTRYPGIFMEEAMGFNDDNGMQLSPQQKELFLAVGDLAFAKKLKWDNRDKMERVTQATKKWAALTGISIKAGKGVSKTASETLVVMWFLFTHQNAKIPIIGPTENHLRTVFMAEVHKWLNFRNPKGEYAVAPVVRDCIKAETEKIFFKDGDSDEWGKKWFAFLKVVSKSTDKEITRGIMSGLHEDNLMPVFDEAAAIAQDEVFEPLENTLTGRCNFCLMTFNPSRNRGFAYDTHMDPVVSKQWIKFTWNAEEAPDWLISKDHIKKMEEKYGGKDTNNYRVNVLGEFPTADDGSLIPFMWIQDSIDRDIGKPEGQPVIGLDVARDGADQTILCVRHGYKVLAFHRISAMDSDDVAIECLRFAKKYMVGDIFVDSIGVGAGVYDRLRHYNQRTFGVKVSERANNPDKFPRLRDELWWKCRVRFEKGLISIPDNRDLIEQLSSVTYSDEIAGGKIKIESKENMKRRLGGSPDYADALNLTFVHDDNIMGEMAKDRKKSKWELAFEEDEKLMKSKGRTWMSA